MGLDETVILTGYRPDARRLMQMFDVFALASTYEGLSIALLEAMAIGVPVVITRVGGSAEVVTDGRDGYLVPPRDVDGFADRVVTLLGDRAERERLANAAQDRATAFDIRSAVSRTESVYRSVLGSGSDPVPSSIPTTRTPRKEDR